MRLLGLGLALLLALVLGAGALTACDDGSDGAGVESGSGSAGAAAEGLATALGSGAFADVEFTDTTTQDATADYRKVVEGMGDVEPSVTAADVEESDGSATATLDWRWQLGESADEEWAYTTTADLTQDADGAWQVAWSRAVIAPKLAEDSVLDVTPIVGSRGPILGGDGYALVTQRPVVRFGIDKSSVKPSVAAGSARELAGLVDIDPGPYVKQVKASGDEAFVEAIVFRKDDVPSAVTRGYRRIKGALAVSDDVPLAVTREFAAPILGTVGPVTAEMIEDDPDRYQIGDTAGLSGLQARYDDQLQGIDGVVVDEVKASGAERQLFRVDARQGTPLRLTMSVRLQTAAESALASIGPSSALVAIRPSTGAILAAANGPGTDGYNVATYGQAAPGSTTTSRSR